MNSLFGTPLMFVELLSLCFVVAQCTDPNLETTFNYQTSSRDIDLNCSSLTYKSGDTVVFYFNETVYNSSDAPGIKKKGETTIAVLGNQQIIYNAKCQHNDAGSPTVNIPYLNIDKYEHNPNTLKQSENTTISCKVDVRQFPIQPYSVLFLLKDTIYLMYGVQPDNKISADVVLPLPGIFEVKPDLNPEYPLFKLTMNVLNMTYFQAGLMKCSIKYDSIIVGSNVFDLRKNHSAGLIVPSILFLVMGVLFTPIHALFH